MKKVIGTIGILLSLLTLSLEIYALPLLQYTEAAGHHSSHANVWRYAAEPPLPPGAAPDGGRADLLPGHLLPRRLQVTLPPF